MVGVRSPRCFLIPETFRPTSSISQKLDGMRRFARSKQGWIWSGKASCPVNAYITEGIGSITRSLARVLCPVFGWRCSSPAADGLRLMLIKSWQLVCT